MSKEVFIMRKRLLNTIVLASLLLGSGLTSCSSTSVDPLADGVLTIGLECAYSPFNYTEYSSSSTNLPIKGTSGEYCGGYDILIAKKLAEDLGVNVEVVRCDWDGLIPQVQAGTIDAIIAGMTDTEQRRNSIDFTDEYYSSQLVIVTKKEYQEYKEVSDFAGKTFIAQIGTVQADLVSSLAESDGIIAGTSPATYPEAFMALQAGTVDGVICETPVASDFLSSSQGSDFVSVSMENNEDFIVSVSIGISKNAVSTYKESLNASLAKISQEERQALMNSVTGE
jgi:putative lysine transport system substrate-binding protein